MIMTNNGKETVLYENESVFLIYFLPEKKKNKNSPGKFEYIERLLLRIE